MRALPNTDFRRVIVSCGADQKLETRRHLVLFGLILLEPGGIVDVMNGGNVHDRSLHPFGHEYQCTGFKGEFRQWEHLLRVGD